MNKNATKNNIENERNYHKESGIPLSHNPPISNHNGEALYINLLSVFFGLLMCALPYLSQFQCFFILLLNARAVHFLRWKYILC